MSQVSLVGRTRVRPHNMMNLRKSSSHSLDFRRPLGDQQRMLRTGIIKSPSLRPLPKTLGSRPQNNHRFINTIVQRECRFFSHSKTEFTRAHPQQFLFQSKRLRSISSWTTKFIRSKSFKAACQNASSSSARLPIQLSVYPFHMRTSSPSFTTHASVDAAHRSISTFSRNERSYCSTKKQSSTHHHRGTAVDESHQDLRKNSLKEFQHTMNQKLHGNVPLADFGPLLTLPDFAVQYNHLENGTVLDQADHPAAHLAGRIASKREASKNLTFYTIARGDTSVQILFSKKRYSAGQPPSVTQPNTDPGPLSEQASDRLQDLEEKFVFLNNNLKRGDVISAVGFPGRTKTGELTLYATDIRLLTPCQHNFPSPRFPIVDPEIRYAQRYLDFQSNPSSKHLIETRSKVIQSIRDFLLKRGFLEVETPILNLQAGGATAKPFMTHADAFSQNLALRIAPELYLKQLIIGGFEKVFEIGKLFRNEGVDHTHYPEFTSCEFYEAYQDYTHLMTVTEQLLRHISTSVSGSTTIFLKKQNVHVDLREDFERIDILPALQMITKRSFPNPNDEQSLPFFVDLLKELQIPLPFPLALPKVLDKLIGALLEPNCIKPTFLLHHPLSLSPLAKVHPENPHVTQRFELFMGGTEICNAYSELNESEEQRRRFDQMSLAKVKDPEIPEIDKNFVTALEWGMPPTAGWGLGIDRLVMLLTGTENIKDILTFSISKAQKEMPPLLNDCEKEKKIC